jgi:membrane fusion protein (multidrug efflux system)
MTAVERAERTITDIPRRADSRRTADPARRRTLAIRAALIVVGLAVLIGVVLASARYWTSGRFLQTTDDAYVQADSSTIAPKVSGYIASLLVGDNETVKAGQPLAVIDERDLRAALDEASANTAAAQASVANLDAQIVAQGSLIRQADANVTGASAALALAQRDDVRRQKMAQVGYGSEERADDASTDAREKSAALVRSVAAATTARQQVPILNTQRELAQAQLARAQASLRQAQLNLSYATIVAPIDGTVGARTVRVGQYVQAGTQLMVLVPLQKVYVVANFKETQLTSVHSGQPARIKVDTFPGDDVVGRVDSLAPASGMEFALLPPDNATGNFTKIVQRIPVKITFDGSPQSGRLRPGMSVEVAIDTKGRPR